MLKQHNSSFEHSFYSGSHTYVHPSALIGPNVSLGPGVKIGPFCVVLGNTHIGSGTRLSAYVTIGYHAQHTKVPKNIGKISIGTNCEIREYVSIHAPINEDGATVIGNNCYIMNYSHIAHNATLEDHVIVTNQVSLAGHVYVEHHAYIMANVGIHQFCRIGQYSCLTPYSGTRQDIPPFSMFSGQPAGFCGLHTVLLKKAGIGQKARDALKEVTTLFYHKKISLAQIRQTCALQYGTNIPDEVARFIAFVAASTRGVSRRTFSYSKG